MPTTIVGPAIAADHVARFATAAERGSGVSSQLGSPNTRASYAAKSDVDMPDHFDLLATVTSYPASSAIARSFPGWSPSRVGPKIRMVLLEAPPGAPARRA